jgi:hypothetical protein
MKDQKQALKKIEHLTNEQKQQLFNVEELETRLEMAAFSLTPIDGAGTDETCTKNSSCGW